jgi:hypothetical protein
MALVTVGTYTSRPEAELAGSILRSEGITFVVAADDAGGAYGGVLFTPGARLQVDAEDAQRAADLLTIAG